MLTRLLAFFGVGTRKRPAPPSAEPATVVLPTPAGPRAVLVGLSGAFAGVELELDEQGAAIGRDPLLCEVALPAGNEQIAERHCHVSWNATEERLLLEDCWSETGTYVGASQRLAPGTSRVLAAGERFYLGDASEAFEVRFE